MIYMVIHRGKPGREALIKPEQVSIAILPLDNLTGSSEQTYFVNGIHDALIGELGQISALRVISRTSTLRYPKSKMLLQDIARELGVNVIVEGSVYGSGDSIRIQLQLIEVFPEERHLWAKEYHEDIRKALAMHSTVVHDIAKEIQVSLTSEEETRLSTTRLVDPETYKAYLRGMFHLNQTTPYSAYLACEYWWLGKHDQAQREVENALKLAPENGLALYVQGSIYSSKGMHSEAIKVHRKAVGLSSRWKWTLGHTYFIATNEEETRKIANELKADPRPMDTWGLAEIYTAFGDKDEAFRWLEESYKVRFSWIPWIAWNPNYRSLQNDPRFDDLLKRMNLPSRPLAISNR